MSSDSFLPPGARNQTDVFAVHGADPEVLAYAMAKYSRSALSMRESLTEISAQRAEQFLNTFYFQYGHRSIADLAHIAFAVERLSPAGRHRPGRRAALGRPGAVHPLPELPQIRLVSFPISARIRRASHLYAETINNLFATYQRTTAAVLEALRRRVACPATLKPDAYERTLKARAFDVARYLLPLATNTSLGQIVNARTLETQVSRLLSNPLAEIRELGVKLREAATGPAWNVNAQSAADFIAKLNAESPALAEEAASLFTREVRTAPTLVKYAEPNQYLTETRAELEHAAAELLHGVAPADAPVVDLVERTETLEVELAATLVYWVSHHPYRQVRDLVAALPAARIAEITELGLRHRGRHDEALRAFHSGAALRFDILMDIGGFRDMHRHRRVTQIQQGFTALHGYETPAVGDLGPDVNLLAEADALTGYQAAIEAAHAASARIAAGSAPEAPVSALYLLPLATRVRCLFKMDFAEAQYISELRSAPAGHFSYRRVAWEMYLALERRHPSLAKYIRVTDFTQPIDLLQR